jgi:hypothetical protein
MDAAQPRLGRSLGLMHRCRAKQNPTPFVTHRAATHALPPSLRHPFCPLASVGLFFLAAAQVKEKTSRHRQKGKTMRTAEFKRCYEEVYGEEFRDSNDDHNVSYKFDWGLGSQALQPKSGSDPSSKLN